MIQSCILFFSMLNGIDPALTKAVISVESSGKVMAIGKSHGELGLLQIRPQYVPENAVQLLNPCTNVMVGTRILGQLKKECPMCIDKVYVNMYNLGRSGAKKLRYPRLWKYHRKVLLAMEER